MNGFFEADRQPRRIAASVKTDSRRPSESDPRNHLYENFLRTIDYFRPKVAVMENVPAPAFGV